MTCLAAPAVMTCLAAPAVMKCVAAPAVMKCVATPSVMTCVAGGWGGCGLHFCARFRTRYTITGGKRRDCSQSSSHRDQGTVFPQYSIIIFLAIFLCRWTILLSLCLRDPLVNQVNNCVFTVNNYYKCICGPHLLCLFSVIGTLLQDTMYTCCRLELFDWSLTKLN